MESNVIKKLQKLNFQIVVNDFRGYTCVMWYPRPGWVPLGSPNIERSLKNKKWAI